MKDGQKEVKLKVGDLSADRMDYGRGIARLSTRFMKELGIKEGDYIEIEGKRKTVAIAVRAYPSDVGLDIIRIDGLTRRNAGAGVGEVVKVRPAEVKEARKMVIAPAQKGITIHTNPEYLKQNLYRRAFAKGDIFIPNPVYTRRRSNSFLEEFFGMSLEDIFFAPFGDTKFIVVNTNPKGYVWVGEATEIELLPQAVEVKEEEKIPEVTYEHIGGLKNEIKLIREMVELPLRHPEVFQRLGIKPPKGVLLYGPPGTGKTLLAKAVANESGANFYSINGPEIMSMWYGKSEENLRQIFEEAEKNAPSIIFIDEIDAIAPKREEVHGEVEKRIVSQLLTLMDGLKGRGEVIVIGATNRPDALDPALRRPGRFDRELEIGVPDKDARLEILQIHSRNMPVEPDYNKTNVIKVFEMKIDTKKENIKKIKKLIEKAENLKKDKIIEILKNEKSGDIYNEIRDKIDDMSKEEIITFLKDKLSKEESRKEKYRKALEDIKNLDEKSIKQFLKDRGFFEEVREKLIELLFKELAERTYGYVGADLEAVCKEAAMAALRRVLPDIMALKEGEEIPKEILEKLVVTKEDFEHALGRVEPSAMREVLVEVPNVKWDDIGGLEEVKQQLKEVVEWPLKYPDVFERMGIKPPKGVLLYGPPGTGKTLLAKAVANESGANFISIKGPELLSKWVGESERRLRETFKRAKQVAPCIIFFDEIDAITSTRGIKSTETLNTLVSQLLTEMSGIEEVEGVVVLAATNRPDLIDLSLLRPGRFDRQIYVPTPDEKARLEILRVHTKKMPLAKDVRLEEIAKITQGYSGADLEALCREAAMIALREDLKSKEVKKEHFDKALKTIKPSIPKEVSEWYERFTKKLKMMDVEEEKEKKSEVEYAK